MKKRNIKKEKSPKRKVLLTRRTLGGEVVQKSVGVKKALRLKVKDERAYKIKPEDPVVTSACHRIIDLMVKSKTGVETRFSKRVAGGKFRDSLETSAKKLRPRTQKEIIAETELAKLRGSVADYEIIVEELKKRQAKDVPVVEAGIVRKVARGTRIPFETLVKALKERRIEVFEAEHFRQGKDLGRQKQLADAIVTVQNRIKRQKSAGVDKQGAWIDISALEGIVRRKGISYEALSQGLLREGIQIRGERKSKAQRDWEARR